MHITLFGAMPMASLHTVAGVHRRFYVQPRSTGRPRSVTAGILRPGRQQGCLGSATPVPAASAGKEPGAQRKETLMGVSARVSRSVYEAGDDSGALVCCLENGRDGTPPIRPRIG